MINPHLYDFNANRNSNIYATNKLITVARLVSLAIIQADFYTKHHNRDSSYATKFNNTTNKSHRLLGGKW